MGVDQVGLHAYSSGGPTAIAYVARYPERVSRLVLGSTFPSGDYMESEREFTTEVRDLILKRWPQPVAVNLVVDRLGSGIDMEPLRRRVFREFLTRSMDGPAIVGFFDQLLPLLWRHVKTLKQALPI